MPSTTRAAVDSFLALQRIAFVGVSREAGDFNRGLYREFLRHGYDVVPVHPSAIELDERACAPSLSAVDPPPQGVLIMLPAARSAAIVEEAARLGIRHVWLYRGVGQGSVSDAALKACESHGIEVVAGECPYMFFPQSGWIHSAHRFFKRLAGSLPA